MIMNQIATILNSINQEMFGEIAVADENLTNIVDVGKAVDSQLTASGNFDKYIGAVIDRIGRVMYVDRTYNSTAPSIMKDSWEYGSILMKVRATLPDAKDNLTWPVAPNTNLGDLDGNSIDPFVISTPDAKAKLYNKRTTFEVPITFADYQLREAFTSPEEMSRFFAMIENRIRMKITLCTDALIMRTINNLILQKVNSGKNVINLLAEYNTAFNKSLTSVTAMADPDFLKFAAKTIMMYKEYLKSASSLYNESGYITFTPADKLKAIFLSEFAKNMEVYLYGDTYHNEFVKLEGYEEVPYWQGSGTDGTFASRSTITGIIEGLDTAKEAGTGSANGSATTANGVVAVLFDEEAALVCNEHFRVTSIYNPRGEYTNYFYKWDSAQVNDVEENCVVFTVEDESDETPANFNVAGKTGSIFGIATSKIQNGITVEGNKITGTLIADNDVDSFTTVWGKGYFIALQFSGTAATTDVKVGVRPDNMINLDSDKDALFKLNNPRSQSLWVQIGTTTYRYDLSGLTLS